MHGVLKHWAELITAEDGNGTIGCPMEAAGLWFGISCWIGARSVLSASKFNILCRNAFCWLTRMWG